MRGVELETEESSPGLKVGKREAARARKTSRKEGKKGPTWRTKKEEEEREEENRGWMDEGKREGEAAELPADPSSVSVEANDAKTGVHCPQLRARRERD